MLLFRSLTEYVQHHKPQHYDKFETGTAFAELGKDPSQKMSLSQRIMADYSREELQVMRLPETQIKEGHLS